jgi:hypothetical protein
MTNPLKPNHYPNKPFAQDPKYFDAVVLNV